METSSSLDLNLVETRMILDFSAEAIWEKLIFYENISEKKPFVLRWLLPVPLKNEKHINQSEEDAMCLYKEGYLRKRPTKVIEKELYEFSVVEQGLPMKFGIRLYGGRYLLQKIDENRTEVIALTSYSGGLRPRWLWKPLESTVCHWFHRYLLHSIHQSLS